jgi:hypothetical protein
MSSAPVLADDTWETPEDDPAKTVAAELGAAPAVS